MLLTSFNFSPSLVISIQQQLGIDNKKATKFVLDCINIGCNTKEAQSLGFKKLEILHLQDVKNFLNFLRIIFSFSLFFILLLTPFTKPNKKLLLSLISVFILLLILALINFDFAFEIFHEIFFKQNYEFPSSYLLIKLFPQEFFILCFIFSSLFSFFSFIVVFFVAKKNL